VSKAGRTKYANFACLCCHGPSRSQVCPDCERDAALAGFRICRHRTHQGNRRVPANEFAGRYAYICRQCAPATRERPAPPPAPASLEETRARFLAACDWWDQRDVERHRQRLIRQLKDRALYPRASSVCYLVNGEARDFDER